MSFLYLTIAVVFEVIATSALKASEGFTRLSPSVAVIVGYSISFYMLSLCLRQIPLGVTYAIWSGLGIVLTAIVGWIAFKEVLDAPAIAGIGLILAGVLIIRLFSTTATQV